MQALSPSVFPRCLRIAVLAFSLALSGGAMGEDCDPAVTFADGRRPLREVFVGPAGDDATADGSTNRPFRSLAKAAVGARPGDAFRLLPGVHRGGHWLANLSGTAEAPIWIGGVPGQPRPVIAGGNEALHLSRVRYVIVEHLEVREAANNGINCDDGGAYSDPEAARFVVFRNLHLHDIGTGGNQDALKLSGLNDYFVLDCEFARTSAGGSGIDHVGCHRGVIARCRFTDMGSNAIQCKGGTASLDIRQNRFIRGGQRAINLGGSTDFPYFRPPLSTTQPNAEARDLRVFANVFQGAETPVAFVGAVNCLVANNTIIEPRRWLLRVLQETVSRDGRSFEACASNRFLNNVVVFRRSQIRSAVNIGQGTAATTFEFAHNLWFALDEPGRSAPDLPVPEQRGVTGFDPAFRDAEGGDYRLKVGSPAIGAGRSLPNVKADCAGTCFLTPPGVGAFENVVPSR